MIDPTRLVAELIETAGREGFFLAPDTRVYKDRLPTIAGELGESYYVVAGYDVEGTMIHGIAISFFDGPVELTADDLRPYEKDAQAIVALLT